MRLGFAAFVDRLRTWRQSVEFTLARKFGLATREDRIFLVLIAVAGVFAGVLGVGVHTLIDALQRLLFGSSDLLAAAAELPLWRIVAAPVVGGLLIVALIFAARGPTEGPGMGILIESVALRGGRVPVRPILISSIAAIFTVGSGGPLGREGPMIRLGAMMSSRLGSRFRLPPHRIKVLVGCGAAAGLAATYNIPIGGALFAMEVILGNFAPQIFGPIVGASVISTVIARSFEGNTRRFALADAVVVSRWEILTYTALGVACALASIAFVVGVRKISRSLQAAPVPDWVRPVPGMALFGLMAAYVPQILEGGQDATNALLLDRMPPIAVPGMRLDLGLPALFLAVAAVKIVSIALVDGSGGVGGKFTPSLLVGALVGGAFGDVVHQIFPNTTAEFPAYAAVGMAAIAAGTSHAPISAILILFEFTGNYDLVLPLMVACITSSVISRKLYPYSIYTEALQRKGVDLNMRLEEAVMASVSVRDLVREDPETLHPAAGYREVVDRFFGAHRQRLFVVDDDGRLLGEISLHDIKHVLEDPGQLTAVVAHDLLRPAERTLLRDDRLDRAAEVFSRSNWERLPVIDAEGRFQGVLSKRDLLAVYAQEVLGRPALLATFVSGRDGDASRDYVELPPDFAVRLVAVPPDVVGRTLAETRLPQTHGVRVIEIKRGGRERVIPGAETVFEAGDEMIVLGPVEALERLAEGRPPITEAEAVAQLD